jgi:protein translocase SecG subunit
MQVLASALPYGQIILSIILITAILLQQSGTDIGGALGGGDENFHHTRRGFEKFLFILSIICGILFALSAVLAVVMKANG